MVAFADASIDARNLQQRSGFAADEQFGMQIAYEESRAVPEDG